MNDAMVNEVIAGLESSLKAINDNAHALKASAGISLATASRFAVVIAEKDAEIERLREALFRLGSMEAFDTARMVKIDHDNELIARIDFARAALKDPGFGNEKAKSSGG